MHVAANIELPAIAIIYKKKSVALLSLEGDENNMISLLLSSISLGQWVAIVAVSCAWFYWYLTKHYGVWEAK